MRQYTLVFMEQRMGASQWTPMVGEEGMVSFQAEDDEGALDHIEEHYIERLKQSMRAEFSSMNLVPDPKGTGMRLVDDSHANPNFMDTRIRYNPITRGIDVDFESTQTAVIADLPAWSTLVTNRG